MAIFVVNITLNQAKVAAAIAREYPDNHHRISEMAYFVSATGTAEELAKRLQISDGENLGGVVTQVAAYFGRAPLTTWAWVKEKWESAGG